jgi:rare lipoprotein A
LNHGSIRVRVEALDPATYQTQGMTITEGVYLQVGAFSSADNAQKLIDRLTREPEFEASRTRVVQNGALHRVQVGPYSSEDAAHADRERMRERLDLNAVLVRRE